MAERKPESLSSLSTADGYYEAEPNAWEWIKEKTPTGKDVGHYVYGLFPFTHWITRYNVQWLSGDLIAGLTVACVVVPQSMAYAKLATLAPEYGLYSSFMGVLIYWFFATSKDITIGPVAVLSTVTGTAVTKVLAKHKGQWQAHEVASSIAIIVGVIVVFLGLTRLGFIVDFISLTAIAAFMTGSAINIGVGQFPALMGITGVNNRGPTYRVIIDSLKALPSTKLDAAMGLTALAMLYLIRGGFTFASKKYPSKAKLFFFFSTLRTAFVILLYTLISYLVNRHHRKTPKFAILKDVPRGFKHAAVPIVNKSIISAYASELPALVIVTLIEHISISKSFGRVNNYVINPSQELVAMGVTNCLGPFLGAYPATGSFSRTAIKSKAGVRTPFAGVITALIVLIAIYGLNAVFYYIPSAALSAVIIHAVGDLITPPKTVLKFWKISPIEVPIFFAGVLVTIFTSIENGIYTTVAVSAAILVWRLFKAQGRFVGKVKVHSIAGDSSPDLTTTKDGITISGAHLDDSKHTRNAFLPIDHKDGSNPIIEPIQPHPGIFIYRFSEGFNYPNSNHYLEYLTAHVFKFTRRTNPNAYKRPGDRPWNDPGPSRWTKYNHETDEHLPTLKAIILDFSSINNVDVTAVQNLIDVRNQLDRYTSPETVEWHFASINNRWTKRALAAAGFGFIESASEDGLTHHVKPIFSVAEIGGSDSAANAAEYDEIARAKAVHKSSDIETGGFDTEDKREEQKVKLAAIHGLNLPLFHLDLTEALASALSNTQARDATAKKVAEVEGRDTPDHIIH